MREGLPDMPKKHRGISIDFWTDEKVVALSPLARLLFIGSWHYCCDQGHLTSTPIELKMRVLPADNCDVDALVEEIVDQGLYVRSEAGISVPKLPEHQQIDKRWAIRCGRCEATPGTPESPKGSRESHTSTSGVPHEDHARSTRGPRDEVNGSEVKGSEGGAGDRTKPRKRGTRLPDIFPISEDMAAWGREHAPDVDAMKEHDKFCDYWRGVSGQRGVKADWIATWRNWMRKAQEDAARHVTKPKGDNRPDWMLA